MENSFTFFLHTASICLVVCFSHILSRTWSHRCSNGTVRHTRYICRRRVISNNCDTQKQSMCPGRDNVHKCSYNRNRQALPKEMFVIGYDDSLWNFFCFNWEGVILNTKEWKIGFENDWFGYAILLVVWTANVEIWVLVHIVIIRIIKYSISCKKRVRRETT